ncbi:MAG: transposase [Flavobacteriales bacterium]|nr:transposase [Flavobacteriales bacterium]
MELHRLHSPRNRFKESDKHRAVQMYLSGGFTKNEITQTFGISYTGLDRWIQKYGPLLMVESSESEDLFLDLDMKKIKPTDSEELQRRIAELEKKLERANLKSELLETMIDIAEEELHIPIRKKYGPQPSNEKHKNKK